MNSQPIELATQVLETKILADFRRYLGQTVRVSRIMVEEGGRSVYRNLSRPALVEVVPTDRAKVLHYSTSDRITPEWNVRLVERHEEISSGASLQVFGTTRQMNGESFLGDAEIVPMTASLMTKMAMLSARSFVGAYRKVFA
ncbi:hypothetical protein A8H39_00315 [Paraburkholderia fungorum]|uniref:hypothetical protein n=1 Tax=Paraburkholderia fungorum TaxID=134537 RepID=UPI000484DBBC|nr:hypothetical protein [Paraburkholderia fungorum]PNE59627.1 hypothetical protein A8H39_00315 [Paraburkholderia fungorum]